MIGDEFLRKCSEAIGFGLLAAEDVDDVVG